MGHEDCRQLDDTGPDGQLNWAPGLSLLRHRILKRGGSCANMRRSERTRHARGLFPDPQRPLAAPLAGSFTISRAQQCSRRDR